MKYGVLDIGTNSLLYTVVEKVRGEERLVRDEAFTIRLGEGLKKKGKISEEALERLITTVERLLKEENGPSLPNISVFSTEVMRRAENSQWARSLFQRRTGLEIRVLSGEEEALCNYYSIKDDPAFSGDNLLICDIGGGSTELISVGKGEVHDLCSCSLGAVALKEEFLRHEIPLNEEINEAVLFIRERIPHVDYTGSFLVGIGGTITTLGAMKLKMEDYDGRRVHGLELSLKEMKEMFEGLRMVGLEERSRVPGLSPSRADIILSGSLILFEVMKKYNINSVKINRKGARFGVSRQFRE